MGDKKLIDRNILYTFRDMMKSALSQISTYEDKLILEELIVRYENLIINTDKETLNGLKRDVYLKMINTKDKDENKKLYELYQTLKELSK